MMANMFVAEFGDLLATEDLSQNNILPSPNQLLRKIILKGRPKAKKKSRGMRRSTVKQGSPVRKRSSSQLSVQSYQVDVYKNPLSAVPSNASVSSFGSKSPLSSSMATIISEDSISQQGVDIRDNAEEELQVPLSASMARLIVYCKAMPYKKHETSQSCCEMHSLGENTALELIEKAPQDAGMHINQGFFRTNAGYGYVLKPEAMRSKATFYHPTMQDSPIGAQKMNIHLKVLSGQFVDTNLTGQAPLCVEVESVGVDHDNDTFTTEACANHFNPVWKKQDHFFSIIMPELCVLYFKVYSISRTSRMVLQNTFPVGSLKQGLRYIPMKTLTGVDVKQNGIFVSIKIETSVKQRTQFRPSTMGKSSNKAGKPRRRLTTA